MSTKFQMVLALVLISVGVPAARAQHGHGDEKKGEEHGKPAEFKMPTTYKDAVKEIEYRLHEIEELMAAKHLDQVHAQADVIRKVANQIGQLAAKSDSGVPKEAVKDINLAGKDLAAKFDAIDKAGDSGDMAGTKKAYEGMVAIAATLQKYAMPATYKDAVEDIEHRLGEVGELIEAKKLDEIQAESGAIQKVAKMVAQLAQKEGSGVPKESVKEVSSVGDDLAAKCDGINKACKSGDLAGAKKGYDEMVRASASLKKYVAVAFQCPMKCEGAKTYDKPGKCPKCGMEMKPRT